MIPQSTSRSTADSSAFAETLSVRAGSEKLENDVVRKDFYLLPIPRYLRYDHENPPTFGKGLGVAFLLAATVTVANQYYCQPLLIQLSRSFDASYSEVSKIPTLVQAGYAVGLLLLSPLGDIVRSRPLTLTLTFLSMVFTLFLPLTNSVKIFEGLSFLVGVFTIIPQVLMPLAADLASPERRSGALSIVIAGIFLGVLVARVLSGVIAQFVSWHVVYFVAVGLQFGVLVMLYFVLPDCPPRSKGVSYWRILYSMGKYAVTEPILVQGIVVSIASMACFNNFWVTLTFLLGGAPYFYSTLVIGLFGLVGMFGVGMGPVVGRLLDGLVPWATMVVASFGILIFYAIQAGAGGVNIAAVVMACFGIDVFRQIQQVSVTSAVFGLDENARARLNAVLIISMFIGQVMGTSVGTKVFLTYGWRASAALSLGWTGFTLLVMFLRGPHCSRYTWFGYEGGTEVRKGRLAERKGQQEEKQYPGSESDVDAKEEDHSHRNALSVVSEKV